MSKDLDFQYPKTAEQWWQLFEAYKTELRDLVCSYHPSYARRTPMMPITAPNAEMACDLVRERIESKTIDNPLECFDQFYEQKNGNALVSILNQTWFGVPESRDAHSLPGFGALCDLCSESYVLEPETYE